MEAEVAVPVVRPQIKICAADIAAAYHRLESAKHLDEQVLAAKAAIKTFGEWVAAGSPGGFDLGAETNRLLGLRKSVEIPKHPLIDKLLVETVDNVLANFPDIAAKKAFLEIALDGRVPPESDLSKHLSEIYAMLL